MPFKGTDIDAFNKAGRFSSPEKRSKMYNKYKKKNKLINDKKGNIKEKEDRKTNPIINYPDPNSSTIYRDKIDRSILNSKINKSHLDNINKIHFRSTINSTLNKINFKDTIEDKAKDIITEFVWDIIKQNIDKQILAAYEQYKEIKVYIELGGDIYKIISKIKRFIDLHNIKISKVTRREDIIEYSKHLEIYKNQYNKLYSGLKTNNFAFELWSFGGTKEESNYLFNLVRSGEKTATSYLYNKFKTEDNNYSYIKNYEETEKILVRTISKKICKFNEITAIDAFKEGEGDKSLIYWQNVHEKFFTQELKIQNKVFSKDVLIVFEEFELVN